MPKMIGAVKLYPVEEIMEALDTTKETVRRYLKTGHLKGQKFGKRWYVTEESLRTFFNRGAGDDWKSFTNMLQTLPEEDETLSQEELQGLKEAQEEMKAGKGATIGDFLKERGL